MPGIYICVRPTDETLKQVHSILSKFQVDLPLVESDDLHITIMHQDNPLKSCTLTVDQAKERCKPDRILRAAPIEVQPWRVSGGKTILVIKFASSDLVKRFQFWNAMGLHSDYTPFSPHMTITGAIEEPERLKALTVYLPVINEELKGMKWEFHEEKAKEASSNWKPKVLKLRRIEVNAKASIPKVALKQLRPAGVELDEHQERQVREHGFNTHSKSLLTQGVDKHRRFGKTQREE